MDSLANYGSDDENEAISSTNVNASAEPVLGLMEGDNYDDVQMEMSENPLNGSKAPSAQAHSPGRCGGAPHMAPPACATIPSYTRRRMLYGPSWRKSGGCPTSVQESGSESAVKDDDGNCSPLNPNHNSSSSSPASTALSHGSESDEHDDDSKSEDLLSSSTKVNHKENLAKDKDTIKPDKDQTKRDLESRRNRDKERERDRDKECDKDRLRERDDKDRRKDYRREDRHRSRSRDQRDKLRSPDRSGRRQSKERERDSRRKSKERRSSSREYRRRDADRRHAETNRRDTDRKRHRSHSRSVDRHRLGTDSRSSSSSGSSKSDARSRDAKVLPSAGSRSRSKSQEKERSRTSGGDSRKLYMEKKIDRKMNVLERMGIELKAEAKSSIGMVTPQMLVQRTMEQQVAQVKQATGVELPSYYNAAAVNPQRLVDQIQKRKLLWGSKKEDPSKATAAPAPTSNKWQGATFAQDQDGKLTAKFNRLMGIKQPTQAPTAASSGEGGSEIIKKQEEMFHNMESQYEVARLATHTHRGLGLGFGTFQHR